jgi:CBS domain-containing protein
MRIADVLRKKGTHVCTITHHQKVSAATRLMHQETIGSVVVVHDVTREPVGLVSQTEILAALNDLGNAALDHCATGIMRRPFPSIADSATIEQAMTRMTRDRARHLIVVDEVNSMLGIVSIGDLVAARLRAAELEADVLRDMARSHVHARNEY